MGRRSSKEKWDELLELLESSPSFQLLGSRKLQEVLSIYGCLPGATWQSMRGFLDVLPLFLEYFDATAKPHTSAQREVRRQVPLAESPHEGR